MYKKNRNVSLLCLFILLILSFLLLAPLLFPVLGSNLYEYDYVDNNLSDVDSVADRGTHSNFSAQQQGPDSIYDALTEGTTGGPLSIEDFVDSDSSDVDNSPDKGTHSDFDNMKAKDGLYDTLTETAELEEINRDSGSQGQSATSPCQFSHTLGYGSGTNRLVVIGVSFENSDGGIDITGVTYNGQTCTEIAQVMSGTSGYAQTTGLFYILDNDLPTSPGTYQISISTASDPNRDIWGVALSYGGVRQSVPDDYDEDYAVSSQTMVSGLTAVGNGSIAVQVAGVGNIGAFTPNTGTTEVVEDSDINSAAAVFNEKKLDAGTGNLGCTHASMNRGVWIGAVWQPAVGSSDFDLDLEVQFVDAIDFLSIEELCIYMGDMGGEDLNISYWTGSSWVELASDLTASSWNNFTVSLTSPTFTIRFEAESVTGDATADQYQVDAVLLHVEGVGSKEDAVDNDTSNVDSSSDYGTLSNFDNMKTKGGMATLTEGLNIAWSNNTQPTSLVLETSPDVSGSAATHETYGLNNLAADDSTYGGGDVQDCGAVNDPQEVSLIMDFDYSGLGISGSDLSRIKFEGEVYFIGGTGRTPISDPWEMETTFYNGSVDIYNWDTGSWEIMGTVFIDNPSDLSLWDNTGDSNPERPLIRSKDSGFSDAHMSTSGYVRIRIKMAGVFQGTAYDGCSVIDYVDVDLQYGTGGDYTLDQEVQWTGAPYKLPNEELCIYGGTMGNEDIRVDVWNGTGWETLFTDLSSGWNNRSVTDWLTNSILTIRFKGGNESGDMIQDEWQIDIALIHIWTVANYQLDLEVQWTNANYTQANGRLCIYGGTMASESLKVDVWNGSTWQNLFTNLSNGWNNISVSDLLVSPTFTIRFKATAETEDSYRDIWQIDCTLLHTWGVPPIPAFSHTPGNPYTDESVIFNASASYDPDGTIISYFWDFGDGSNATGKVTTHSYSDNGNYTVTLTVTDNDGLSDSESKTVTVLNRLPLATFTESKETVLTSEPIEFNASSSYDPDGSIVGYYWDFGDGTNTTGATAEHAYADNGNYTVTLTVTDDDGATDNETSTKTVLNRPPTPSFTESSETANTGQSIIFNASSSYDPDGSIVGYYWDFGDGTNATGGIVEHHYANDGNYTVTLTVTDDDGAMSSTTSTKTILNRPPTAAFTESSETIYTTSSITFNASSSYDPDGSIVGHFWDFGDGTNTTGVVVSHSYVDDGDYTVALTVTDDDGATASTSSLKTVLNRAPIPAFTESAVTVNTGDAIVFNASSSYDSDGTIVSYFWDFGDDSNATGETVSHSYVDDGDYTVTLTVMDDDGATDSVTAAKTVLNRPPIASFTESAETVLTSETIYFNASASYDPDGTIVSYLWSFGDGTNSTGITTEHVYSDDGNYTVTLTVTDDDGATSTATADISVLNRPPTASFTESAVTVYTGDSITFNASDSYDPDGSIVGYFWDFGDGSNGTGVVVSHSYADDGNYTAVLTVVDDDGDTNSATAVKTVLNRNPVAAFTESSETVYIDEIIAFNASGSYDPDGSIVGYFWDFGDGSNATGVIIEHSYADDGNYTVTLTVTDDDGKTETATALKSVSGRPPIASFTESAVTVSTGEPITFNATESYDPDGVIVGYFWDFGDGSNGTGVVVSHSYADDGNYTVVLTVTDDDNATSSASATKTILNRSPTASFTESAVTVYTGDSITFNASDSYDPDGSIVGYFWDFGDGSNATGAIVTYSYTDDGNYTITLTVTDDDEATDTSSSSKTVLNRAPVSSFTESAETAYTSEMITLNASASYDSDGSITNYYWDFGDGTNASGIIVQHQYAQDGNYAVTLTVTDDDGATASASSTKTVLNRPPVASFTESAVTVYTGDSITFNASDSYDPDGVIASYYWDFGDGTNATEVTVAHSYLDNGNYTVTLAVTDDENSTSSSTTTKTVLNRGPVASFTETKETAYTNEAIEFNASSSYDSDGSVVSYYWDFGDNTNATGKVTSHLYADDGNYTVTLTVTDDDGATGFAAATKNILNRAPVAAFTESAVTVYTGDAIVFNASSSYDSDGTIVSYFWDFGDNSNATGVVVSHSYVDDGNYTATLIVTDDDGTNATAMATKTILNRSPVASFSESAETVYTGEYIALDASGSYDLDGSVAEYFWDFGDGTNATGVLADHSYVDDGNYTVTLTVTDDDGATASTSALKTVLNRPPVASFTESAETVYTDEIIILNASSSYDPDGIIVSYFWDFGDGTNATDAAVSHSYVDDGNYNVTLTVTDEEGASTSVSATKTVLNRVPVATFTESTETVYTGNTINFDASGSYDPDGSIVSYLWSFGDGTNGTGVSVGHSYADDGSYTVTLTVTDDDGAISSSSAAKTVVNRSPVASFTQSKTTAYTGETITFDASGSYDPDGTIVSYLWSFGDGDNATGEIVNHSYVDDGNYMVTLTVTDNDGAISTATGTTKVLNRSPTVAFTETAETVFTDESIFFNASSSYDPDGSIISYFWDFGDGTNATGSAATHSYPDDGNYTVTLTVTDDDGATSSTSVTKTVLNRPPVASFTESTEIVVVGETIYFNASASYDPDGTIVSYLWSFGDGDNATGVTVEHAYSQSGSYTVTLTVTDDDSGMDTTSAQKTVGITPPVAIFTESAETVLTNEIIQFNASASYDPDGTIVSYLWSFGDGDNATGEIVNHSYVDDGNYTVTLTVTDNDGATDSTTSTKTVLNRPPVASFSESAETAYTAETITFDASASYDSDGSITSYFWSFGDGTNASGITVEHSYTDNDNYTVILTVTDDDGTTASTSATKTILNRSPIASFTESAEIVYTNEAIYFNASGSYDSDGTIVSYYWDFGDNSNATGVVVSHSYVDDGDYTVALTVADDDASTASVSATKTVLNRAPIASFTESAVTVVVGEIIYFNASGSYDSDGSITSYLWSFGDGFNATGVAVEHAYLDDGSYTVTLTVTDDDGVSGLATAVKHVANTPPVSSFTETATTVYTNEAIYFNASGSYDSDGTIVSYYWDFGDNSNATGVVVSHSYVDDGDYTVALTVTDDDGATASTSATKTVNNRAPVASFTESAETVSTGEIIYFNASASYDSDGVIVSYFWDFGDGLNTTGVTTEHTYTENGVYTVTLTITDDDGATSQTSSTKNVGNTPPFASFTESKETVYTGETISFDASDSYDPDGSIVSYFWDFGDGTNATGTTTGHFYGDNGNYTVTLTVTDDDGATDTSSATKTVLNRAPIAEFTQSKTTAYTGEQIHFDASDSYDPDGSIVSYYWDFGDGTNATGMVADHIYTDDGDYITTLVLTDDDNTTGTATGGIKVLNRPPVPSFAESAVTVYTGDAIVFNASSSYDSDGSITSYLWSFGDGFNATGVVVSHSYVDDGDYTVALTVTDDDGATASTSSLKTVLNRAPIPAFTESAVTVYTGDAIVFNASSSYDSDGSITSYLWSFGDGFNATGVVVSHSYVDDGDYTVALTVTDDDGATASTSATKTVNNRAPVASFTESAETVSTGEIIYFNASGSYDSDGSITSYLWSFGDGFNATGVAVSHSYVEDGDYTVMLNVTDDDGTAHSSFASKTVLNRPPTAVFTESAETVYMGQNIIFNASTSYDVDGYITVHFWDFGDGSNATGMIVEHAYETNGSYTVTLTVTDNDNRSDSTSSSKTILWNDVPLAIFTESAETVYTGETISFDASGSYDPDGSIVSYFWDFGDGANATEVVVDHSYVDDGNYTVALTVRDDNGATGTATAVKTVLNRSPVAQFTESAETVYTHVTISFDASGSYDPDGSIVSYFWDFGDGANVTGVTVDHAYSNDGNYTVVLTVEDDDGTAASTSSQKIVLNRAPSASFMYTPSFPILDETVTFNASQSHDPDGYIINYTWNFGDGNTTTSTVPVTTHIYATVGNYTVVLTIVDDDGATGVSSRTVEIRNYPTADFSYIPTTPGEGQAITFNATSSKPNGGYIINYTWNFGDGNTTTVTSPLIVHVYEAAGNYSVNLNVTDSEELSDSLTQIVKVGISPVAGFTYSPSLPYVGDIVEFNASESYDPDGTIINYTWNFGDGNITSTSTPIAYHTYNEGGSYPVRLTVSDDDGVSDTTSVILTVEGYPTAVFTWAPIFPIAGSTVTFNASHSSPNGGEIVNYSWNFGDGTQLNVTDPVTTHSYSSYGDFTVKLTVVDSYGLSSSISQTVSVREYPVADFTWPSPAKRGMPTRFDATASRPEGGSIVTYLWNFGDGNVTETANPVITHIFEDVGMYQVNLTVTDSEELSSSKTKTAVVVNTSPFPSFTCTPEKPKVGEPATFNASASYDVDGYIVSYSWDFGDGTQATGEVASHTFTDAGIYQVGLTVEDNDGHTNSTSKIIEVIKHPLADFSWSPYPYTIVDEPATFNASSSLSGDGSIVNYRWDFDDGNVTTTIEPVIIHVFNESGAYRVNLTITNSEGLSDSIAKRVDLYGTPYASFTWTPDIPLTSEEVTFNASASEPNGGFIQKYIWNFGDGASRQTSNPITTHQFTTLGTYNVTLEVRNSAGLVGTVSEEITILSPPQVEFAWTPESPHTYDEIMFDASSSSSGSGSIVNYFWDFGDGNMTMTTDPTVTHRYFIEGNYMITLNVTNSIGLSNATSRTLEVSPAQPPSVEFYHSPYSPGVYEEVTFNATESFARGGVILTYDWDFGDGNTATAATAIAYHTYNVDGNYTIRLNVTNTAGYWNITTRQIEVVPISNPKADFTWSPSLPYFNRTVTFNASTSTPGWNGTTYPPITQYIWDFGDGTNATTATQPTIDHIYTEQGNYTVTLTVVDADGRTADQSSVITVSGLIGDINGDGKVDMRDIAIVAKAFGTEEGDPNWNPDADLTGPEGQPDGKCDMRDVAYVSSRFGDEI